MCILKPSHARVANVYSAAESTCYVEGSGTQTTAVQYILVYAWQVVKLKQEDVYKRVHVSLSFL